MSVGVGKTYEFKPTDLGMGGTHNGLSAYKTALKQGVDSEVVRLSQIGPSGPNVPTYLKWTIDNIGKQTSFLPNPQAMKDFFKNMGKDSNSTDSNFQHYNKLLVYWGDCLGPIWFMENHSDIFPENSKVYMPPGVSEGLWDFKVNESQISVKAPKGSTNVIKPQDVVANPRLATEMRGSKPPKNVKKLYKILEVLAEEKAFPGPAKVLYGTDGSNGLLSKDFPHMAVKTPTPPPICTNYEVQKANWKSTEQAINSWGKDRLNAPAIKLLMHNFLKYSGLTMLKMTIDKSTGVPDFTWGSNLTKAELKGKGQKHGERMGVGIEFDGKFYTDGF